MSKKEQDFCLTNVRRKPSRTNSILKQHPKTVINYAKFSNASQKAPKRHQSLHFFFLLWEKKKKKSTAAKSAALCSREISLIGYNHYLYVRSYLFCLFNYSDSSDSSSCFSLLKYESVFLARTSRLYCSSYRKKRNLLACG